MRLCSCDIIREVSHCHGYCYANGYVTIRHHLLRSVLRMHRRWHRISAAICIRTKRILFWKILQRIFIFKSLVFHQVIVSGIIHGCSLEFVSNAQEKEENGPECLGAVQALHNCART